MIYSIKKNESSTTARSISRWLLGAAVVASTSWAQAATYYYIDWLTGNPAAGNATGVINMPGGSTVNVTFQAYVGNTTTPSTYFGFQNVGGTGTRWSSYSSTYTSAEVSNTPPNNDHLRLTGDASGTGRYVMTFSEPVINPIMVLMSLGGAGPASYVFNYPFSILSSGPGGYGIGPFTAASATQLDGNEGNGVVQFTGAVTRLEWTALTYEVWQEFTFGIKSSSTLTPVPQADLSTSISAPATAGVGQSITVTGNCTNNGPVASTSAGCVLAGLPVGATQSCTPTSPSNLANGASMVCTSTFAPTAVGTLNVKVNSYDNALNGGVVDPNFANDEASQSITVVAASADMAATVTALPAAVTVGDPVTVTATCTNNGPTAAATPTCTVAGLPVGVTPTCTPNPLPASLASGSAVTCTASFPVPALGTLSITATAGSATTDPTPANNTSAAAAVNVSAPVANMGVTLSASPLSPTVGQPLTLTATCTNAGPNTATTPSCSMAGLPPGVTATCTPNPLPASLASGASIVCSATFTPAVAGPLSATASTGSATSDPVAANNSAAPAINVAAVAAAVVSVPLGSHWVLFGLAVAIGWMASRRRRGLLAD